MAVTNRAAKIATLHKVAKRHYQPVKPPSDRSVLEHMLYACCLEDSQFDAADIAFARLQQSFFDWNEVRVTTAVELAEVMDGLRKKTETSARLKRTLHSMFESHYSFDIDQLRKENLGKAVQKMEKYRGITPFVVSYVAQNALGGHSIPVSGALVNLLLTVGIIDEKEAAKFSVPGLERAIPKNKGADFFSLVHQLSIDWVSSPFNKDMRAILLTIDKGAQERFPKRTRAKKAEPAKAAKSKAEAAPAKKADSKKADAKKTGSKKADPRKSKPASTRAKATKTTGKKTAAKKPAAKKTGGRKSAPATRKKAVKKSAAKSKKQPARKKATAKKPRKKSPNKRLARKKPR